MKLHKIENVEGFKRDAESNAILNTDVSALAAYKKRRSSMSSLVRDIDHLKDELSEMKKLVVDFINSQRGS